MVDDISHEGLRVLLRAEGVTFQRLKTWKASKDPQYQEKKARVEQLYAIADREAPPGDGDPEVVFCVDEFGPLNLQPRPGRQWAAVSGKSKEPGRAPRPRMRATYHRTEGVRHLFAAYELGEDKLFGHVKPRKTRTRFLEFCRYLRSLYPPDGPDRDRLRQLQPASQHARGRPGRNLGGGEQRRIRLHAGQLVLVKPHRGAVHGAAVLRAGRDRPRQAPRAGQHDPPVHHLAQQPRLRRTTPPHRRQGKRCLRRR